MDTRKGNRAGTDGRAPATDPRHQQLMALAKEGNEDAVGDLFREFGVQVSVEGSTHDAD